MSTDQYPFCVPDSKTMMLKCPLLTRSPEARSGKSVRVNTERKSVPHRGCLPRGHYRNCSFPADAVPAASWRLGPTRPLDRLDSYFRSPTIEGRRGLFIVASPYFVCVCVISATCALSAHKSHVNVSLVAGRHVHTRALRLRVFTVKTV